MEFQPHFHSLDKSQLGKDIWAAMAVAEGFKAARLSVENAARQSASLQYELPSLQVGAVSRNNSLGTLVEIYKREQRYINGELDLEGRNLYYFALGKQIKDKKQYPLIGSLHKEFSRIRPTLPPVAINLMVFGIYTLYLLASEPQRMFVGLKGGIHWKSVKVAVDEHGEQPALLNLASHYVPMLSRIGRRELVAVPESLIHPDNLIRKKVQLPSPDLPMDNILEDAYFHQRYLVPPAGAEVRYRRARNIAQMLLVKSGTDVLARVITSYGDEQVIVNLEDASYIVPDRQFLEDGQQSPWATIVAETYHDLVTANEISALRYKRLRKKEDDVTEQNINAGEWDLDNPQIIYIPRTVRVTEYEERPRYDGSPRPIKPHVVTNYFRTANMTPEQRENILKLEKEWGLPEGEIADNVPAGKTWVKPHFSPKGSEVIMKIGPIFIKRRLLSQTGLRLKPSLPKGLDEM